MESGKTIVNVGDFVTLDKEGFDVAQEGDVLYLAGDLLTRTTKEDPYALRQTFLALVCDPESGAINTDNKPFTVDGLSVSYIGDEKQTKFEALRDEMFGVKEEDES